MKTRSGKLFLSIMLVAALSISLIPISGNLNAYAETTTPSVDFAQPVDSLTQVPDGYIGIYTKADLNNINNNLSGNYILMSDIDFTSSDFESGGDYYNNGAGWDPIGDYVDTEFPEVEGDFSGILDGNGHSITGLFVCIDEQTGAENIYAGLFASISGDVKNLGLVDVDITASTASTASTAHAYAGGMAGDGVFGSSIKNCFITGQISAKSAAGGIVGAKSAAGGILGEGECNISYSKNFAAVTSVIAGGIFGNAGESTFCSMNGGKITGSYAAGGIIGVMYDDEFGGINYCFNTGTVTSAKYAGGIAAISNIIGKSFNTGKVTATGSDGVAAGIAALSGGADVDDCYNTGQICSASDNQLDCVGICADDFRWVTDCYYLKGCGGSGVGVILTDAQMRSQSSFSGFDFAQTWSMSSQIGRPVLNNIAPEIYDINYNLDGGVFPANTPLSYMPGSNNKLTAPTKTGYAFRGWYADAGFAGTPVTVMPADLFGDVSYYGKWGAPILSASSYNYNSNKITWTPAGGATAYRIYRATNGAGPYTYVYKASATAKSWIDSGRVTGKHYFYKVFPVADGHIFGFSTYKSAKPVPATPTAKAVVYTSTSIKVSWTGVSGATRYQVCRKSSLDGSFSSVCVASSTTRSYVDKGLKVGQMYYYEVRAYHLEGTSKVYGNYSTVQPVHMQL